jgi:hypothetical protein
MRTANSLTELQAGDTAWYRGQDGTIYEVRVASVGQAGPGVMPSWVWISWTDVEGGMLAMHPARDLMVRNPNPSPVPFEVEPEPEPEPALEVQDEPKARTARMKRGAA